ncbi:hypothetical protein ACM1RC_25570 [Paenibacillus azoreducens]|uniref:hypothetical protein n=1 Tax=Paenibacillus azoreducens TaxID=116718 RepID=UPI0039F5E238
MKRKKTRDLLFMGMLLLLLMILVYQGFRMMRPHTERADAEQMLYEVSLFQMQVLSTSLIDAASSENTSELNALKLAAYSASYTHDRLAKSLGSGNLYAFPALGGLVDAIQTWQIGGNRPLSEGEKGLLHEYTEIFSGTLEPYRQLLSGSGQVISSKNDELEKAGKKLAALFNISER